MLFDDIEDCVVHATVMDEECEACKAEFEAKNLRLGASTAAVQRLIQDLKREGIEMPIPRLTQIRLETLLDFIMHPRARLVYESQVNEALIADLESAKQQVAKSKLLVPPAGMQGVNLANGGPNRAQRRGHG
jgi:hypothetical protein